MARVPKMGEIRRFSGGFLAVFGNLPDNWRVKRRSAAARESQRIRPKSVRFSVNIGKLCLTVRNLAEVPQLDRKPADRAAHSVQPDWALRFMLNLKPSIEGCVAVTRLIPGRK